MVRASNERSPGFYMGCVAWLIVAILLIVWDFGVVAFCGTIFLGIWFFGLREKFSNEETASAYSVFNVDGRAIVGGFTAKQLDRQMRGGGGGGLGQEEDDEPVRGPIAVAKTTPNSSKLNSEKLTQDERLHRRTAAAAAAEQRMLQQQQQK